MQTCNFLYVIMLYLHECHTCATVAKGGQIALLSCQTHPTDSSCKLVWHLNLKGTQTYINGLSKHTKGNLALQR